MKIGVAFTYLLQFLKNSPYFPWLNAGTETLNKWLSALAATVATVGIHWTYASDTLTITGLSAASLWHLVTNIVFQFATQHGAYRLLYSPAVVRTVGANGKPA
jgi:hypothetical protein